MIYRKKNNIQNKQTPHPPKKKIQKKQQHIYESRIISRIFVDKGNNKITELRTILQRESQNS
jgi:hypothetical protein